MTCFSWPCLFHDIGKAAGKHHEEEGYRRLKNILDRFNLEGRKRAMIEFLVKNHILMSRLAMTRETGDMDVIARFADTVGDLEKLKALVSYNLCGYVCCEPAVLDIVEGIFSQRFVSVCQGILIRHQEGQSRVYQKSSVLIHLKSGQKNSSGLSMTCLSDICFQQASRK